MSEHTHHGPSYKDYMMIFIALVVLTTVTDQLRSRVGVEVSRLAPAHRGTGR